MAKRRRTKRAALPPPDPVFVPSTGEFIGNDGPWSTLALRVGTPAQLYKVLASTASPETWLIAPDGCSPAHGDSKDCAADRGQLFNASASSTWVDWANRTKYTLDDDRQLPLGGVGLYGRDNVSIVSPRNEPETIAVPDHMIARIATKDYFLGMFGLSTRALASEKLTGGHVSNLVDMKKRNLIPSLSYGYTAGAKYRRQGPSSSPAHTQLILGGYDEKAFVPNDVDFAMGSVESGQELSVSVKAISIGSNATNGTPILGRPFTAVIDSSVSHYWLPPEVCDTFARAFDLTYNETVGLYLVNDTQYDTLQRHNPTITITLTSTDDSGPVGDVSIELPYDAFDLRITSDWPQGPSWSRYFPIRPASDPAQYTLGRAFLQEAYLVSNYEARNFSVAQRNFTSDKMAIVPIRDKAHPVNEEVSNAATYGLIAGGCALAGLLILFLVYRCARKREKVAEAQGDATDGKAELESGATGAGSGARQRQSQRRSQLHELDHAAKVLELDGKTRVEADDPGAMCEYDQQMEREQGPFELPANEQVFFADATSSSSEGGDIEKRRSLLQQQQQRRSQLEDREEEQDLEHYDELEDEEEEYDEEDEEHEQHEHLQQRRSQLEPHTPPSPSTDSDEQSAVSPVEGSPASHLTGRSWDRTVSPVTPSDSTMRMMRREPSVPYMPPIEEKRYSTDKG